MHFCLADVTTTERMVRYRFAVGAVLTVCYNIIYLGLRFSIFRIKVDNIDVNKLCHMIHSLTNISNDLSMSQTKTCPKCGGVMKLKDEIQEGDSVSEVTPLDRTYTCDYGHMEVEA